MSEIDATDDKDGCLALTARAGARSAFEFSPVIFEIMMLTTAISSRVVSHGGHKSG
jgi:hypothetical protein